MRRGGTNRARISDIAARDGLASHHLPVRQTGLTKPADEFSAFDIEDVRREPSLSSFIDKVIARIQTLSESDYRHRGQAIAAWKRSPLYVRYLNLGAKSLAESKEVREYIAEHGGDELSYEEFEAIAELNQKLRF